MQSLGHGIIGDEVLRWPNTPTNLAFIACLSAEFRTIRLPKGMGSLLSRLVLFRPKGGFGPFSPPPFFMFMQNSNSNHFEQGAFSRSAERGNFLLAPKKYQKFRFIGAFSPNVSFILFNVTLSRTIYIVRHRFFLALMRKEIFNDPETP